ncbi:hypothetical protein BG011_005872 [Mortierella polycephala]|uniref:Uncharacterized protein n=1 Tax=Mortierella polycephala TaxID=41804 RepID=A0A9P6PWZ1_9FUNG|nr:hypothetical protein BG011_005872 [Mortierella polycephala]
MALGQMRASESAPVPNSKNEHRALIGDDSSYINQMDNSQGKQVYRVGHNGDSSVQASLFRGRFERRGLLGNLLGGGGDRTSIQNVNDNSQHSQTMNSHGNKHTTITKVHEKAQEHGDRRGRDSMSADRFFDRRDLTETDKSNGQDLERRGLLGGGDRTVIENVNDNSVNKQTMNSHGNSHTTITKVHSESIGDEDDIDSSMFFDRRNLLEEDNAVNEASEPMERRGLLFGGDSMVISNQNDNSKTTKTYNSHHNKDTEIVKVKHKSKYNKRSTQDHDGEMERRGLLFGGDSTVINNQNDNSKTTKTYNSHHNKDTEIVKVKHKSKYNKRSTQDHDGEMERRGLLFGGDSMVINNQNDNSKTTKTYNSHDNKHKTVKTKTIKNKIHHEDDDDESWFSKRGDEGGEDAAKVQGETEFKGVSESA